MRATAACVSSVRECDAPYECDDDEGDEGDGDEGDEGDGDEGDECCCALF